MARRISAFEGAGGTDAPAMGSERAFGIVFAAVFAGIGLYPLPGGGAARLWALGLAAAFLLAGFAAPRLLRPLNAAWFGVGLLLHRVMSPLVLGLLYGLVLTPVGLLMRLAGKDPLRLRRDPGAASYWIVRPPPGPAAGGFKNQF